MSIYILSDPNIVDFVPEKNHQEIAMVKALNQKRYPGFIKRPFSHAVDLPYPCE